MPRNRGPRTRLATGIFEDAKGRAVIAVVKGDHQERRYPATTSLAQLQNHRATLIASMKRTRQRGVAKPGTLAGDAPTYLASVASMPSYRTRALYVQRWVDVFGAVRRKSLTAVMIRTQLQVWATEKRPPLREHSKARPPLKVETLRHLLKVLRHWYTVLDGRGAPNPARDVPMPSAPAPEPRAVPPLAIAQVLRQFRTRSKTRARLAVIATTAMAHGEVMRLKPEHIHWEEGVVVALARRKGKGAAARSIPITTHGRLALRAFVRAKAWGPFSASSMHARFRHACRLAGYGATGWRPYDLRHTMLTAVAQQSRDERAVQEWAGHTSLSTTGRYTLGSLSPRMAVAAETFRRPARAARDAGGGQSPGPVGPVGRKENARVLVGRSGDATIGPTPTTPAQKTRKTQ